MGGGSSKPAPLQGILKGIDYSNRAAMAKGLSDTILTLLFKQADFKDLLSLSSIGQCPRYVFTTAQTLQQLFQTIQVYPQYGKQGEIMFAPIQKLAPGILAKDKSVVETQNDLQRRARRDQMCMDIAYIYVRIFQIYAALALTTLEANPVRSATTFAGRPSGWFSSSGAPARPRSAPLYGGQRGGKIPTTGSTTGVNIGKEMSRTPYKFLIPYFNVKRFGTDSRNFIEMDEKGAGANLGKFVIEWERTKDVLNAAYYRTSRDYEEATVEMRYNDITENEGIFSINGTDIVKITRGWRDDIFDMNDNLIEISDFYKKIHEFFRGTGSSATSSFPSAAARRPAASSGSSGVSLAAGKSSFESFDQVKKLYDDYRNGFNFPKAYCVARALTLLSPIFDSEVFDPKNPYYVSQVCKKEFDFEVPQHAHMPRAGKQPKANVYLRSLASLYYDTYQLNPAGQVIFSQTPEAQQEFKGISKLFASLYNITTRPEEFLESGTAFTESKALCGGKNVDLIIKDPKLRMQLLEKCVKPMLDFQQKHTVEVNKLLQRMFIITQDKLGGQSIAFSKELKTGRAGVNMFGKLARDLLARYYQQSEVFYIQGVRLLEQNPAGIQQRI